MFATIHRLQCIVEASFTTIHRLQCIVEASFATIHCSHCIVEASFATIHRLQCIVEASFSTIHHLQCIVEASFSTIHRLQCIVEASFATITCNQVGKRGSNGGILCGLSVIGPSNKKGGHCCYAVPRLHSCYDEIKPLRLLFGGRIGCRRPIDVLIQIAVLNGSIGRTELHLLHGEG